MNGSDASDGLYIRAAKGVFWVFCLGIFAFATLQVWPVIHEVLRVMAPFILGLILAYLFHPVVQLVQHRLRLGRMAGIGVVAVIIVGIFVAFFAILIPILYQQVMTLIDALGAYFTSDTLNDLLLRFLPEDQDLEELKAKLLERFDSLKENLGKYLSSASGVIQPVAAGSADAARDVQRHYSRFQLDRRDGCHSLDVGRGRLLHLGRYGQTSGDRPADAPGEQS